MIADLQPLEVLQSDIINDFIQAHTKEKIFTKCGPEFGDRAVVLAITERSIYVLKISAERFRTMLVNYLRTLDFKLSRFDRDIWMILRDDKTGYDYICTHVDDFTIAAKDPTI